MFSQSQEEKYILDYFGDYVGTFIDLGCNDCTTFSNTRALALKGWRGVFVDPSQWAIDQCKTLYNGHKGYYFYPVGVSKHNGKAILYDSGPLCSANDRSLVSTFHQEEVDRFKRTVRYAPIEVKTFKWKTFYNRLRIRKFDFVNMDCEGDELNILPDMDLSNTKAICIEWNSKPELKTEYEKFLEGFRLIYTSGENLIYAR